MRLTVKELRRKLGEERAKKEDALIRLGRLESELEELTQTLFEESNAMVREERRRVHALVEERDTLRETLITLTVNLGGPCVPNDIESASRVSQNRESSLVQPPDRTGNRPK